MCTNKSVAATITYLARRSMLLVGVAITSIASLSLTPSCAQPAEKPISVTIQPTTTALPLVVADKKGFFAKNKIKVKWSVSHVPISDSIAALGHQFDVAMGTQPALIAAVGHGVPVVEITGGGLDTVKTPTANIVARKGAGITKFKQLQGKTIGTLTLTGNIHFSLLNTLQKEGVDLKSIHWVIGTVPLLPDLLKGGRVDAIEEIEPFATKAVAAGGVALGDPFRSIGDRAFIGLWLSNRAWANNNKDVVLRFNKSLDEAAKWIRDNPAEAKKILSSYTGLKGPALKLTPIPEYQFSTTAADLAKQIRPDLLVWLNILKRTSDLPPAKVESMLPNWAN